MINRIESATDDDLLNGLDMAENLYYVCTKKYEYDEARYWKETHTAIYEELERRGINPYPYKVNLRKEKFSW